LLSFLCTGRYHSLFQLCGGRHKENSVAFPS
jgi:hypothetical protein